MRDRSMVGRLALLAALVTTLVLLAAGLALGGLDKGDLPAAGFSFTSVVDNTVDISTSMLPMASPGASVAAPGGDIALTTTGQVALKTTYTVVEVSPDTEFGWHYHNGPVIVTATTGTLTYLDSTCETFDLPAGHTYIESPGEILNAKALPDHNPDSPTVAWFTTRLYGAGATDPVPVDPPCTP